MNLYDAAVAIATEAHGDDKDQRTGRLDITHALAVAKALEGKIEIVRAAGVLHDVVENTSHDIARLRRELRTRADGKYFDAEIKNITSLVSNMTRGPKETYAGYILRIASTAWPALHQIKRADLRDNLKDHPPGARRDKYELALMLLDT